MSTKRLFSSYQLKDKNHYTFKCDPSLSSPRLFDYTVKANGQYRLTCRTEELAKLFEKALKNHSYETKPYNDKSQNRSYKNKYIFHELTGEKLSLIKRASIGFEIDDRFEENSKVNYDIIVDVSEEEINNSPLYKR